MASPARLAYQNLLTASGVVITSSGDATGYSKDNLAHAARWKKWRSPTGTGDQWWKADLGANKNFQLLAAISAKVHASGGTLKAQANATDVWTTPTVNDTLSIPSPDLTQVLADWLGSVQNLRWIRFYFTNVGAANDYAELGAVFAGTYLEPAQSLAPGHQIVRVDPSVQRYAIGGQRSSVIRSKYHDVSGQFRLQAAAARENLRALFESTGKSLPCIYSADPATPSLTWYGTLQELSFAHVANSADLWDAPFRFLEDVA